MASAPQIDLQNALRNGLQNAHQRGQRHEGALQGATVRRTTLVLIRALREWARLPPEAVIS